MNIKWTKVNKDSFTTRRYSITSASVVHTFWYRKKRYGWKIKKKKKQKAQSVRRCTQLATKHRKRHSPMLSTFCGAVKPTERNRHSDERSRVIRRGYSLHVWHYLLSSLKPTVALPICDGTSSSSYVLYSSVILQAYQQSTILRDAIRPIVKLRNYP